MEGEGDTRFKAFSAETMEARALVASLLREIDAASTHVVALRSAVSTRDRLRIVDIRAHLHYTWNNTLDIINRLEQISGQREPFARRALQQSQESARPLLTQVWELLLLRNQHKA